MNLCTKPFKSRGFIIIECVRRAIMYVCNVQRLYVSRIMFPLNFFLLPPARIQRWAMGVHNGIRYLFNNKNYYFYEIHCYAVDSLQRASAIHFFPSFVHLLTWHLMLMMLIGKHVNVSVCVRAQRNGVCASSRLTIGMDSRVHQPANGKHEFKLSFTQMQNSRKSKRNKTVKQRDASSFLACKLKIAMAWRNFTVWWLACNTRRLIAIDMVF